MPFRLPVWILMICTALLLVNACAPAVEPMPDSTQAVQPAQAAQPSADEPTARSLPPTYTPTAARPVELKPSSTPLPAQTLPPAGDGFDGPLSVVIFFPADEAVVFTNLLQVSGEADPGTVLEINDFVVVVGADRHFMVEVPLEEGMNIIELTASDDNESEESGYLVVTYEPVS
jgi:hypothetical protein